MVASSSALRCNTVDIIFDSDDHPPDRSSVYRPKMMRHTHSVWQWLVYLQDGIYLSDTLRGMATGTTRTALPSTLCRHTARGMAMQIEGYRKRVPDRGPALEGPRLGPSGGSGKGPPSQGGSRGPGRGRGWAFFRVFNNSPSRDRCLGRVRTPPGTGDTPPIPP